MRLFTELREYQDFAQVVIRYADMLVDVHPGSRILIIEEDKVSLAAILIACFEKGVVSVPIAPEAPEERRRAILSHSRVSWTWEDGKLTEIGPLVSSPAELRVIVYTSGTTGLPKGVMLSRRNLISNAHTVSQRHDFKGQGHCSPLPLYHVNAMCMSLFGSYFANSTLVLVEKFNPASVFDICGNYQCGTISLVPTLIGRILETPAKWPESLRYVISAAAPLSQGLAGRFFSRFGPRLIQGYGLSEATNFSFIMPLLDTKTFMNEMVEQYPPVGHPLPGTDFKIDKGEVLVRGENNFMGYLDDDSETKNVLSDGWLRTGDLGEIRNGFLVLRGRKKEIILRGGETIYPAEVESFYASRGLPDFMVVGVVDEDLGEDIGVVVEERDAGKLLYVLGTLPGRYQPCCMRSFNVLRTSTGKVQRKRMSARLLTGYLAPTELSDLSVEKRSLILKNTLERMFERFQAMENDYGIRYSCVDLTGSSRVTDIEARLKSIEANTAICCIRPPARMADKGEVI